MVHIYLKDTLEEKGIFRSALTLGHHPVIIAPYLALFFLVIIDLYLYLIIEKK